MNNKKEVATPKEYNKHKSNVFLFLLFFLPVIISVFAIIIFSIESFQNKVDPFFMLIVLFIILYIIQTKIIDKYAKSRQIANGKLYSNWMSVSSSTMKIMAVVVIIIVAIIYKLLIK